MKFYADVTRVMTPKGRFLHRQADHQFIEHDDVRCLWHFFV